MEHALAITNGKIWGTHARRDAGDGVSSSQTKIRGYRLRRFSLSMYGLTRRITGQAISFPKQFFMRLPNPLLLGAVYGLSELYLAVTRRSRTQAVSYDCRSLILLWTVIIASLWLGIQMVWLLPGAAVPFRGGLYVFGFIFFLGGLALRWYSIGYLGRYFTVDVSISAEHKLIASGPYRYIRHPTYAGALLAFVGLGFCFGNWLSILFLTVPIIGAFLWRIRIEENALSEALGTDYRVYMERTKRLIPWIY
jgi:protein-S-isoprenylcysteine O-methyltransferase